MVCRPGEGQVNQHKPARDDPERPRTWKIKTCSTSNKNIKTLDFLEEILGYNFPLKMPKESVGSYLVRRDKLSFKHKPQAVLSGRELCQNTRLEQELVILTPDHHTSTNIQLLKLRCRVKGDVVARDKALPLFFKANFVL